MNRADTAAIGGWTFLGISSMAQAITVLQLVALALTIVATAISIFVHIRNKFWVSRDAK